jgi:hypothetical protein
VQRGEIVERLVVTGAGRTDGRGQSFLVIGDCAIQEENLPSFPHFNSFGIDQLVFDRSNKRGANLSSTNTTSRIGINSIFVFSR